MVSRTRIARGGHSQPAAHSQWVWLHRAATEYLRPSLSLTTVVGVFVVFDARFAAPAAGEHGWPFAAAVVMLSALLFWGFARSDSDRTRLVWLGGLIGVLFLLPEVLAIASQGPNPAVHDGILLTDSAADRLLHGLSPYGHDYIDSAQMRRVFISESPVNWGLGHFVYPPGLVLLDLPLRALHSPVVNMTWLWPPALICLCLAASSLGRTDFERIVCVVAVVLNPGFLFFFSAHYNDLLFLIPALGAVAAARRQRVVLGGVLLGLALCLKQSAFIFVPFLVYLAYRRQGRRDAGKLILAAGATVLLVVAPFVAWNPSAFVSDTAGFFFSSGTDSDPIRGYGLTGILLNLGVIPTQWSRFPSGAVELAVLVPVVALAVRSLNRSFSWSRFWLWLAAEAMAVFFFGRLMAQNYFQLFTTLVALGLLTMLRPPRAQRASNSTALGSKRLLGRSQLAGLLATVGLVGLVSQGAGWLKPNGAGYRIAMAPIGDGGIGLADSAQGFLTLARDGRVRSKVSLPDGIYPLSLSLDGDNGMIGTGSGLWITTSRGRAWSRVAKLPVGDVYGQYSAVSVLGRKFIAGSWASGLWRSLDAGQTWHAAEVPRGDLEFESILAGEAQDLVATELGVLRSTDDGQSWSRVQGLPDRMTALSRKGSIYWAGSWRGNVFKSDDGGRTWIQAVKLPAGVWSMASGSDLVGTTIGLYRTGTEVSTVGLSQREVVAVASSGGVDYAARSRGDIFASTDGGRTWAPVFTPTY
jgi:photosystem II stability/assembly factor-like uncharacterized protein